MSYTEKCCSRCGRASWDSSSGNHGNICDRNGKPCDTNGTVYTED